MKIKFKSKAIAGLIGWALVDIVLTVEKIMKAIIEYLIP